VATARAVVRGRWQRPAGEPLQQLRQRRLARRAPQPPHLLGRLGELAAVEQDGEARELARGHCLVARNSIRSIFETIAVTFWPSRTTATLSCEKMPRRVAMEVSGVT